MVSMRTRYSLSIKTLFCLESSGLSDDLNYTYLTTVSNEECRFSYGNQITDNMVCVAGNFDEGTCIVRLHFVKTK